MAIFHLSLKIIGRSKGRSAVACAAYRSGTKLYDQETDQMKDYTRKNGVEFSEIMLPKNAPAEFADREKLWNAVQNVETQKNAQLAREVEVAFPNELPPDLQIKCLREFVQKEFVDKGMVADVCIHKAVDTPKRKKKKNDHAHIMLTTRGFKANGEWAPKEKKDYARDENGNKIPEIDPKTGLQKVRVRPGKGEEKLWKRVTVEANDWNKKENAEVWRQAWADACNRALAEIQSPERVDHRSFERQGIGQIPTVHEGYAAREIEARGGTSELCEYNRQVIEANGLCVSYQLELAETEAEIVSVKAQIEAEKAAQKAAAERLAKEKEQAAKSTLTPEQKEQIKGYYSAASNFWKGYRLAQELVTNELQKAYQSPESRKAYRNYRRAQYLVSHSPGLIGKGLALVNLLFAKADYEKEQERVELVKVKRDELRELCQEALGLSAALKDANKRDQTSDEIISEIRQQQEVINQRLDEILAQQEDPGVRWARLEAKRQEAAFNDFVKSTQRAYVYHDLIEAQAEWIRLAPSNASPVVNRYEEKADRLQAALKEFEQARANEVAAANEVRHAAFWNKSSKKEALEEARKACRDAFGKLEEFGVARYYENKPLTGDQMDDEQFKAVLYNANALTRELHEQAQIDRKRRHGSSLEGKNKYAEAQKRFKELCQAIPAGERIEAEKALKEARGNVDPAMERKLDSTYAEIGAGGRIQKTDYLH